jgi:hypothetical protein
MPVHVEIEEKLFENTPAQQEKLPLAIDLCCV